MNSNKLSERRRIEGLFTGIVVGLLIGVPFVYLNLKEVVEQIIDKAIFLYILVAVIGIAIALIVVYRERMAIKGSDQGVSQLDSTC